MHYRGFVIVRDPTDAAVAEAMAPHEEVYNETTEEMAGHWDWYRAGGRYDGYLVSDAEMEARETDNGFNFQPENKLVSRNNCLARDVPDDRRNVYFFVVDGEWVERESFDGNWFVKNPEFNEQLSSALATHPEHFVVVVDAHS